MMHWELAQDWEKARVRVFLIRSNGKSSSEAYSLDSIMRGGAYSRSIARRIKSIRINPRVYTVESRNF